MMKPLIFYPVLHVVQINITPVDFFMSSGCRFDVRNSDTTRMSGM